MKLLDPLFILLACAILLLLSELGYANILGRYCVIIVLVAYFSGKAIFRWQQQKQ